MYAVGAADAGGILEFQGPAAEYLHEILDVLEEAFICLADEPAVGGIHHVGGGEAVVHPLLLLAQTFAHAAGESHHVVAGLLLYLADALHIEACLLRDFADVLLGNHPEFTPGLAGEDLYLEVGVEFVFFCPDRPHLRAGIPFYHSAERMFFSISAAVRPEPLKAWPVTCSNSSM